MKKNILTFLLSLLFLSGNAQAKEGFNDGEFCCYVDSCVVNQNKFYAKVFGGANFLQDTRFSGNHVRFNTGYVASGSLGYDWCNGMRLEFEYAFRRNTISKIDFNSSEGSSHNGYFQTSSYMGNLLWDLPLYSLLFASCDIRPFVGAGVGYDYERIHSSNSRIIFNQKWHRFSWQVMTGFGFMLFCKTELSLEYKFHQGGCHFNNHSLGLGLKYKFW